MKIRVYVQMTTPVPSGCASLGEYPVNHPDAENPYVVIEGSLPQMKELPIFLARHAKYISYQDSFYGGGHATSRKTGEYRHRTAIAVVERDASCLHKITVEATDIKDASDLYSMIRSGETYPTIPYEQEQVPPPARNLRRLIGELWDLLSREVTFRLLYGKREV